MLKSNHRFVKDFFRDSLPTEYADLQVQKEDSKYWYFLCPFHEDHHPSMIVNKSGRWSGHFRCWACGDHGSPRRFAKRMGKPPSEIRSLKPKKHTKPSSDKAKPRKDFAALNRKYQASLAFEHWEKFSTDLGIERQFFDRLGIGYGLAWHRNKKAMVEAFSFPMYDENRNIIGIRFRFADGMKTSEKGCRTGLFLDENKYDPESQVLLCEGVTDTAAALALGFQAIGRPNANALIDLVYRYLLKYDFACPIIVSDNDGPGMKGAYTLAGMLTVKDIPTKVIHPPKPYKDLREWFVHGAKVTDVQQLIEQSRMVPRVKVDFLRTPKRKRPRVKKVVQV